MNGLRWVIFSWRICYEFSLWWLILHNTITMSLITGCACRHSLSLVMRLELFFSLSGLALVWNYACSFWQILSTIILLSKSYSSFQSRNSDTDPFSCTSNIIIIPNSERRLAAVSCSGSVTTVLAIVQYSQDPRIPCSGSVTTVLAIVQYSQDPRIPCIQWILGSWEYW